MTQVDSLYRLVECLAEHEGIGDTDYTFTFDAAKLHETDSEIINAVIRSAKECGYITIHHAAEK